MVNSGLSRVRSIHAVNSVSYRARKVGSATYGSELYTTNVFLSSDDDHDHIPNAFAKFGDKDIAGLEHFLDQQCLPFAIPFAFKRSGCYEMKNSNSMMPMETS